MFRYDSSRLGRFMTPDPLAGTILNPQSLNRYAYVRNDPVNLVDPLGLFAWPPVESFMNYYSGEIDPWHMGGGGGAPNCHWECVQICFVDGEGKRRCREENCRYVCDNPFDASLGSCQGLGCLSGHPPLMIDRNIDLNLPFQVRRPGESFTECWNRATAETYGAAGLPPDTEIAAGILGAVGFGGSIKWTRGMLGGWTRPSSALARRAFGHARPGAVKAFRLVGKGLAVVGAAAIGIRVGAAYDCIQKPRQ